MSEPINDGGPAFPVADTIYPNGQMQYGFNGMSLRDYFAGQALAGILACPVPIRLSDGPIAANNSYSKTAFVLADAMIAAREAKQ
jgi:hypothetical protein